MASKEREALIRQYAAGEITWSALRDRGFENYDQVSANSVFVPRSPKWKGRMSRRDNAVARSFVRP